MSEIINFILRGLQILEQELKRLLVGSGGLASSEQRVQYLNTLKIFMFLAIEFTTYLEKKHQSGAKDAADFIPTAGKRGNSGKSKKNALDISLGDASSHYDWNEMREKLLDSMSKLVLLNVQKLWDPPIAEEQFVIMLSNLCYRLMESACGPASTLRPQAKKSLRDLLCHILAVMIKRYNHSYGACVMIIQTLPHYEHLSALYADLVHTCVTQLGYESILPEILREFRHTMQSGGGGARENAAASSNAKSDKENPNSKFYAQFLIDLADRLANHLLPYLSLFADFLDDESYLMRNAVLYIYGELVVNVLNEAAVTAADAKAKQTRNELIETLLEHVHDSNALSRSRTLQIWRRVADEKAVPLSYYIELMRRCIGRMEDVASSVRKSAFQLLCDLIRHNPYGIKSIEIESPDEIKASIEREERVLAELEQESTRTIEQFNRQLKQEGGPEQEQIVTNGEEEEEEQKRQRQQKQVQVQMVKVAYLKDMLSFVHQIDAAVPKLSRLLFSRTQTDVLETIGFFVTCYQHGFTNMLSGIRKMLALAFNSEKTIKDAVINAYKT